MGAPVHLARERSTTYAIIQLAVSLVLLGALAMLGWLLAWMQWSSWYDYARIAMCFAVAVFAIASARSWQRKLAGWRGLIKVTGARL